MAWIAIICQAASLAKLVTAALGWHFADPVLDQLATSCSAIAVPAASVALAKSDKFVKYAAGK